MTRSIANPVWSTSETFERSHIIWQPKEDLGVMVINEDGQEEPVVVFCSLFDSPGRTFYEGLDARQAGLTLSELKILVATLETMIHSVGGKF